MDRGAMDRGAMDRGAMDRGAMDQRLHGTGRPRSQAGAFAFLLLAGALLIGSLLAPSLCQPFSEAPGAEHGR
jgi:hypothetical protein